MTILHCLNCGADFGCRQDDIVEDLICLDCPLYTYVQMVGGECPYFQTTTVQENSLCDNCIIDMLERGNLW
jgi:hypothetical protein